MATNPDSRHERWANLRFAIVGASFFIKRDTTSGQGREDVRKPSEIPARIATVRGFVAVTDPGWWERLSRLGAHLGPIDANFWRPSSRRIGEETGTPFLFKLRAPMNAIAGFGYFANFSVLPDWLAWDTFGEANGVQSLAELRKRLTTIREGASIEADPQGRIGCSLIAEATFFERDAWVRAPSDWKPRTQTGAGYDLTVGEGLRVWNECLRTCSRAGPPDDDDHAASSIRIACDVLATTWPGHLPRPGARRVSASLRSH